MKNILFITGHLPNIKCGIADYCNVYLQKSLDNDINYYVLTTNNNDIKDYIKNTILKKKIKFFPIMENWNYKEFYKIKNIIKKYKINIIHIQYQSYIYKNNPFMCYLPFLLRNKKLKIITTYHDLTAPRIISYRLSQKFKKIFFYPMFKYSTVNIFSNTRDFNYFKSYYSLNNAKIITIGSAIDESMKTTLTKEQVFSKYNIEKDSILISCFGFIHPDRENKEIVDTISELSKEYKNIKFIFVGGFGNDLTTYNNLKSYIKEKKSEKYFIFTGYIPLQESINIIKSSYITTIPLRDGIITARSSFIALLHMNVPIVGTFLGDEQQDFKDKYNLIKISPKNYKNYYNAFKLLIEDKNLYNKIKNNMKELSKKYSWNTIIKEYKKLYGK